MKWFHHETAARHDPKLQMLGSSHGAEGLGIFWGLLEEIGQHSDTFYLKILGISEEADNTFMNLLANPADITEFRVNVQFDLTKVPKLTAKILAKNLFTSVRKLNAVIQASVDVGLFDSDRWLKFNVLYSPSFEQRADDYTRRIQRKTGNVRRVSEQSLERIQDQSGLRSNHGRSDSETALPETEAEQTERRDRTEREMLVDNESNQELELLESQPNLIVLSEEGFQNYCGTFRSTLIAWNEGRSNKFDWNPGDSELGKLFYGGEQNHKLAMCYHAYKLLGDKIHYAELVLRALRLMLRSSEKSRIVNPLGWIWTCLHGNGDGTKPWVQLLTPDEENANPRRPRR